MTAADLTSTDSGLAERLRGIVGGTHVLTDPSMTASYETDWTGRFHGTSRMVVRPTSAEQVSAVLRCCTAEGIDVCTQGGNTGLVGGSVPSDGAVLIRTERMAGIELVDTVASQVTVGAGATLAAVQRAARAVGLDVGVDFAARDSATIGGMVSTNAGGERVLRWGTMRAQVIGVEAVLADGSILRRLSGLPKDNTGYDLAGLLCGAEGTLGIITGVRLRLVPMLPGRAVALLALADTAAAVRVVQQLRGLPSLEAAELFYAAGLSLVREHAGLPAPFGSEHPCYLLAECASQSDPTDELLAALESAGDDVLDATLASDGRGRAALWSYRESHTESINAAGVPVKLDVAVPLTRLVEAVQALPGVVAAAAAGARTILFGHVNEGNLHVNVLGAGPGDEAVTQAVLRLVASLGGSISAEHGVGRAKRAWLPLSRTPEEIDAMVAIKRALDPDGRLNRGVLVG